MTTLPQTRTLPALSPVVDQLSVTREDIRWHNVAPGKVRLEVTVTNLSLERSRRTAMCLQAAPLGAFLPWKNIGTLWVPPLEPSDAITLIAEVTCSRPRPLGRLGRVPPQRMLTALGLVDDDDNDGRIRSVAQSIGEWGRRLLPRTEPGAPAQLPADPMDLVGHPQTYWAGNINVLVGQQATERHMAQALRIHPGRVNCAFLFVGTGQQHEAYAFEIRGGATGWDIDLCGCGGALLKTATEDDGGARLPTWHAAKKCRALTLQIRPPAICTAGEIQVHVTRRSDGKTAVVEFSLDASAAGPGCHTP